VNGWVVGASGAWGRAVALELIRRGWDVTALGRHDVPELAAWAARQGGRWRHRPLDLMSPDLETLDGTPYALFLCAAATEGSRASLVQANYLGPAAVITEVAGRMSAAGGGRIGVFVGQNARLGLRGLGDYSAGQGALWTWCEAFQAEPDRYPGVTMTRVIPPRTASPTQRYLSETSGHSAKLSPPKAAPLVSAVLAGRRSAGRRPLGAALSMLLR